MLLLDLETLQWLLLAWPVALVLILLLSGLKRTPVCGLCFFYILGLALIHVPGATLLNIEWYVYYPTNLVYTGFAQSTLGVIAFTLGVLGVMFVQSLRPAAAGADPREVPLAPELATRLALLAAGFGLASSMVLPYLTFIPSATALFGWLGQLPVVAICIMIALQKLRPGQLPWRWLGVALLFPVATAMLSGFLGFGVMSLLLICCFVVSRVRLRPQHLLLALGLGYFMLSLFVTYMRDRVILREAVWYQERSTQEVVRGMLTDFEWFDPDDPQHLRRIDMRLNQNWLIGAAVQHIELGRQDFLGMDLLLGAAFAVIPRAIWPDKPGVGGGGDVVSRLTGEEFEASTSVGAGQVLEFYGSYGTTSVFLGMLLLGALLAWCDVRARKALDQRRYFAFTRWFLPGMALCQPGGNLTELSSGMISALIAAVLTHFLFERYLRRKRKRESRAATRPAVQGHT